MMAAVFGAEHLLAVPKQQLCDLRRLPSPPWSTFLLWWRDSCTNVLQALSLRQAPMCHRQGAEELPELPPEATRLFPDSAHAMDQERSDTERCAPWPCLGLPPDCLAGSLQTMPVLHDLQTHVNRTLQSEAEPLRNVWS